jgi:hypothetical protein
MTTTIRRGRPAQPAQGDGGRRRGAEAPTRLTTTRDLAKFTGAVALLAIFADAAVGHALLWENDPYWTYWVTKTFLIATVFGLGTAWLGIGAGRGAVITAVHTVVLTVYYWSLSPIGLPSHPEWLDLEHTWGTGVPVHFGVIYLGYLTALWLWRRREAAAAAREGDAGDVAAEAGRALAVALAVVVVGGGLATLAVGDFPGVTWYLVRLLLTVPFLLAWWALAGRDRVAAVAGGVMLAFVWATYGHFLGPSGLPDLPLRVLDQAPPEATVEWMSYRETWLIAFPIVLAVSVAAMLAVARPRDGRARTPLLPAAAALAAVAVVLGGVAWSENPPGGQQAAVASAGQARVDVSPFFEGPLQPAAGDLQLAVRERNPRVTPLPPHDEVDLTATVQHPDGTTYEVRATRPMVDDPLGRHGTWWGVGLHRWHHGESGIGTDRLPAVHSEVAVFAVGDVFADGTAVATGVPVHVMTADEGLPGRLELDVGDGVIPVSGLPDGFLRVVWDDYSGGAGQGPERARNLFGTGLLLGLLVLAGLLARDESAATGAPRTRG